MRTLIFGASRSVASPFFFTVLLLLPRPGLGFGPVGHETIAYIAEDRLSPSALKKVQAIIGREDDLASIANWADQIRHSQPETGPWHFIDLPIRQDIHRASRPSLALDLILS